MASSKMRQKIKKCYQVLNIFYPFSLNFSISFFERKTQIICLPTYRTISISADEVDRFGEWECNCEMCGKETGILCLHNSLREGIRLRANIRG
jgi:hypothetical protein